MLKVTRYCDHCRKELNETVDFCEMELSIGYKDIECDLCEKCYEDILNLVKDYLKGAD